MNTSSRFAVAHRFALLCLAVFATWGPGAARAQDAVPPSPASATAPTAGDQTTDAGSARAVAQPIVLQYFRAHDQRGLNVFEAPKDPGIAYTGFQVRVGGAFTQQFQALTHSNTATPNVVAGVNTNQLIEIGKGFNNADANLFVDAQLARGVRVATTLYLSARHHNETWVKDGYVLIDSSPFKAPGLDALMQYVTLRVGHFEVNYGDQHFRRSDNGNAMYNPFVGNLLMDALTTEIGVDVYARRGGALLMLGATNGESKGMVLKPRQRGLAYLGKAGFDRQLNPMTRVRLTGSFYTTPRSSNNVLFTGDRAGARYYDVLENVSSNETSNAWSGNVRPGFGHNVTAFVVNPFIKYAGLELFGNIEQAKGRNATETTNRTWNQYAGEAVYRFLGDKFYAGGRYNVATGRFEGFTSDVTVNRTQVAGGWFVTPNLEAKAEYVRQTYKDFPVTDIRNGGRFSGMMVEGVVSF